MSVLVTKAAPEFTAPAAMPDGSIKDDFKLSDLLGKYIVLFFYPLDFTFVCPSEIIAHDKRLEQFKEKGVEVIGVSIDSQFTHFAWKNTKPEDGGIGDIQFPLVADLSKNIARDYGILFGGEVALRGLFLIDKEGIVRHCVITTCLWAEVLTKLSAWLTPCSSSRKMVKSARQTGTKAKMEWIQALTVLQITWLNINI